MKTTNRLGFLLVLALGVTATGCSSDPSTMPGDDDGSPGDDDDDDHDDVPKPPLDATGKYAMHSTFDIATNMPGTAGTVINTIIAATDGTDDPTAWILDQLIAQLPESVRGPLSTGKVFVTGYLNARLLDLAPDFVSTMILVGHDFGDIAKHFGLNETLELTKSGTGYTAVATVVGVHYKLDNQEGDYALANYHLPDVVVNNVGVTMDPTGQLTIAAHKIPLAYGKLLRLGLDAAIIPLIDASAHNLDELLAHKINCQRVGKAVADGIKSFLGFSVGSESVFAAACAKGITAGATFVYSKIDAIDSSTLEFGLDGTARGTDKNNDRKIDTIQTGTWAGTLSYAGTPTPLLPATFTGERM